MSADAERLSWSWLVAAMVDDEIVFLDPAAARVRRQVALDETAAIENVLAWLDEQG